jgi:hypothetical protein
MHGASLWTVKLKFESAGHVTISTNLTPAQVGGRLPDGTPLVELGDVCLKPVHIK